MKDLNFMFKTSIKAWQQIKSILECGGWDLRTNLPVKWSGGWDLNPKGIESFPF